MAEKKPSTTPENKPATEEYDPWKTMVEVYLPREYKGQEDKVVGVNDYRCIIKRGVKVVVPLPVAAQLEHHEKMKDLMYEFDETHYRETNGR